MKRELPAFRRVPVDFGDEPVCTVPIQRLRSFRRIGAACRLGIQNFRLDLQSNRRSQNGFTLVEILVVLVLLSLIVFALMAVFAGTQRAFRASLTQTDTLEGGRAVMGLIASDLENMTPCDQDSNLNDYVRGTMPNPPCNFVVNEQKFGLTDPPSPLFQPLVSSPSGQMRANILENIFVLSKANINGVPSWIATGYSVNTNLADGTLYPLYRFYMTTNLSAGPEAVATLYQTFSTLNYANSTNWSHLMDGVLDLTAQVYDPNGVWMTNGYSYSNPPIFHYRFVTFLPDLAGAMDCAFFSNAVPASVQIEMGTLEDRTLQHAEGLSGVNQSNYLGNAAGQVHLFRPRVWIRNLDLTAYQQ